VFVPYWRVHVSAEGFHVGFATGRKNDGGLAFVLPTAGHRHKEGVVLVQARSLVPFMPELLAVNDLRTYLSLGFQIEQDEMEPRSRHSDLDGEVIDADIARDEAQRRASEAVMRWARPQGLGAVLSNYEPKVLSLVCCH